MLPPPAFRYFRRVIAFSSFLNLFPYSWKWDKKSGKFVAKKTVWTQLRYWIQVLSMWLYQLYTLTVAWALSQNQGLNLAQKCGSLYMITSFICLNLNGINIMIHHDKFPLLINSFMQITSNFAAKLRGDQEEEKKKNKVSRMISYCVFPAFVLSTTNALAALRRPEAPIFLTSLASEPRKLPAIVRLSYVVFHGYLNYAQYVNSVFQIVMVICYVESMLPMVKALRWNPCDKKENFKDFPTKDDMYRAYHELTCVQRIFNCSLSNWVLGVQAYVTIFAVANVFQAVTLSSRRAIFGSLVLILLGCLIFKHLAHVCESSIETLHSWKHIEDPWCKKFLRSCRPFRVAVGPFYYADYTLVLAMLSVIFVYSVNMIVTYQGT